MIELKPINEQVVVLMGASSGIGRETALQFARRGAKVVVSARSEPGLRSLVEQIEREGGQATAVPADVTQIEQVRSVAETAVRVYGRLDTWVHLAAVSLYATFEQTTPEEFKQIIDVNLVGAAHGAMAALPHLRQTGQGALILISSVEALRSLPYQAAYAASKHGVEGMAETIRMELQHEGVPISVTNIMPASINTPFFNKARTKLGVKPKGVPPIYQPSVVANMILYAAENPVRDLFAGDAGRVIGFLQALSPRLTDLLLSGSAFSGQLTQEPKSVDAPNNLFGPIEGYNQIEGDFSEQAMSLSPYTSMQTSGVRLALAGVAVGAVIAMALRGRKNGADAVWYDDYEPARRVATPSQYLNTPISQYPEKDTS
jgi:NAD(P)-dependent dehydrogenase (short-subunit alcohol dehydrogenase family)